MNDIVDTITVLIRDYLTSCVRDNDHTAPDPERFLIGYADNPDALKAIIALASKPFTDLIVTYTNQILALQDSENTRDSVPPEAVQAPLE